MARRGPRPEEKTKVPEWIVSFSDMVTLLLAFFVLLQSFAHVQDPELFFVGQGSYRQAIAGMGIPAWLYGRQEKARREFIKIKHPTEEAEPEHPKPRVIDADNERIRKMFSELQEELESTADDVSQEPLRVEATPIRFAAGKDDLDEPARAYLRQIAFDLDQTIRGQSVRLYVIGLATDEPAPARQWLLSARRARSAEAFLAGLLAERPAGKRWTTFSWGAGGGDSWCRKQGFTLGQTAIVIAVVKESTENG